MAPQSNWYLPLSLLKRAADQDSPLGPHNAQPGAGRTERRYATWLLLIALICGATAGAFIG